MINSTVRRRFYLVRKRTNNGSISSSITRFLKKKPNRQNVQPNFFRLAQTKNRQIPQSKKLVYVAVLLLESHNNQEVLLLSCLT